ncbi:hypothetical protein F2P56_007790 [Juglans regia]|uniref:Uncharacterized protein n=1 Tax=Juglans regia TaxID=51240 RepID=A0A834D4Z0_JUGRE|nr:hypothetical protein F2P56_007790 [Juglans regia]
MEPKRTMTMNWDGLGDDGDEDADRFLESNDRISSAVSLDLASSSDDDDDDEDFDETRTSFASAVSSLRSAKFRNSIISDSAAPDLNYDIWMATPGSINERRKRLLQGMGLTTTGDNKKDFLSFKRVVSDKSLSSRPSPPPPPPPHLLLVLLLLHLLLLQVEIN